MRLTALWVAWEGARMTPGGMLSWLHDADVNLDRRTTAAGTFAQCAPIRRKLAPALATHPLPAPG